MKEILDLIHELRCDINYCKVSGENDTEVTNANETLIKLQELVKNLNISDVIVSSSMWYDNFKIGDTIRYDINVNYRKTGEVKDFILTEEILKNIKKYEDETNFQNMRLRINYNVR